MKTKLLISIILCLVTTAFIYKDEFKMQHSIPLNTGNEKTSHVKPDINFQKKLLDYLSGAEIVRLECERDYKYIESGTAITDNSEFGKGAGVVYCNAGKDKPGYTVRGALFPDREIGSVSSGFSDTAHNYYIKPRLRIKRDLIYPMKENYNEQNFFTPVCRIEIVNTGGKVIYETEYTAQSFLEMDPKDECKVYYSGNYHEGTRGVFMEDSLLMVTGKQINKSGKKSSLNGKPDYRVYWYGYTDMWLDFIEVKNEISKDLLSGRYDMWLNVMDNEAAGELDRFRIPSFPKACFEYINGKINKTEIAVK